jgi:hypothetical protein
MGLPPIQGNTSRSKRDDLVAWSGVQVGSILVNHSRATASKLLAGIGAGALVGLAVFAGVDSIPPARASSRRSRASRGHVRIDTHRERFLSLKAVVERHHLPPLGWISR